ncbi:MAG: sugar phosphate isomerase/epimerase family protein, partial [Aureliella sp.]
MQDQRSFDRRRWLSSAVGATAVGAALGTLESRAQAAPADEKEPRTQPGGGPRKGRIRQSVMGWCFKPMPAAELAKAGKRLGLVAIEGIDAADYPAAKAAGLEISLVGSHGFAKGPVDPENHAFVEAKLRESIDIAVQSGAPSVITFTGMRVPNMRDEAAKRNCLDSWKRVIGYAEEKQITLCLEHLNSRDNSHPMKGHPGYFGDDVELCIEL